MNFKSKRTALLILGVTSIVCSRTMFQFFDDPEGPNLLVVMVTALIVYSASLGVYASNFRGVVKLLLAIFVQILLVGCGYFLLH